MTHDELYALARVYVHKETSTLPTQYEEGRLLVTIEDADIAALITEFVEQHISQIKS